MELDEVAVTTGEEDDTVLLDISNTSRAHLRDDCLVPLRKIERQYICHYENFGEVLFIILK